MQNMEIEKEVQVSVIVPNYNYARYLPMRIESILNQTFTDFELILLDDASTDESVSVLEKYRNNKHVSHRCQRAEHRKPISTMDERYFIIPR